MGKLNSSKHFCLFIKRIRENCAKGEMQEEKEERGPDSTGEGKVAWWRRGAQERV